jgi:branched-chain amino acid transport system ATP-binding protein
MTAATLTLADVNVAFGGNKVLEAVSLTFTGGLHGLVGPNGAGKTTCYNVISGYVTPQSGTVTLDDIPLSGKVAHEIGRFGIGRTFQTPKLVPTMSVLENVMLGATRTYETGHVAEFFGSKRSRAEERRIRELSYRALEPFGLADRARDKASSVPLAVQKMVEIARATVVAPRVLLLDEPAAGLGAADVDVMVEALLGIIQGQGLTAVVIEHDLHLVARICDRLSVLHYGRIIAEGDPRAVVRDETVIEAYLGKRKG